MIFLYIESSKFGNHLFQLHHFDCHDSMENHESPIFGSHANNTNIFARLQFLSCYFCILLAIIQKMYCFDHHVQFRDGMNQSQFSSTNPFDLIELTR